MHVLLKVTAILCKIVAAIEWLALGYWFIGLAIGVDLIFDGIATIAFAAAIHQIPKPAAFAAA